MVKLHLETAVRPLPFGMVHPRTVRVAFDRSPLGVLREARWHLEGLPLAVLVSLLLWGMIAALFAG